MRDSGPGKTRLWTGRTSIPVVMLQVPRGRRDGVGEGRAVSWREGR